MRGTTRSVLVVALGLAAAAIAGPGGWLYVRPVSNPDFQTAAILLETDEPLDPVPTGFSLTTAEEVHAMGGLTPTEAIAQAQVRSAEPNELFGSFIHCWIGPQRDTAHDAIGPDLKWAQCGGWTKSSSIQGTEAVGVWGKTNRDNVMVLEYPWRWMSTHGRPGVEIRYAGIFSYFLNETHYWQQFSLHKWLPDVGETRSGCQQRF